MTTDASVVIAGIAALVGLGVMLTGFALAGWGLVKGSRAHKAGAPVREMYWPTVVMALGCALVAMTLVGT